MPNSNEKKKYTAEEFYKLIPETNERIELLDGEIVAQAATNIKHQTITGRLFSEFDSFVRKNKGKCSAFVSPVDVYLDDTTVVQPDVFIVCDPQKIDEKRVNGAPDLAVEVVSPGNHSYDYNHKLELYRRNGVREYWIIDPSEERTIVYTFGETDHISFYAFDKPIPVGIWDNKLEITVAELL